MDGKVKKGLKMGILVCKEDFDTEDILGALRQSLLVAKEEKRRVTIEAVREFNPVLSDSPVQQYEATGEMTITVHIELKNSL